jgi:hypothetical protein
VFCREGWIEPKPAGLRLHVIRLLKQDTPCQSIRPARELAAMFRITKTSSASRHNRKTSKSPFRSLMAGPMSDRKGCCCKNKRASRSLHCRRSDVPRKAQRRPGGV